MLRLTDGGVDNRVEENREWAAVFGRQAGQRQAAPKGKLNCGEYTVAHECEL